MEKLSYFSGVSKIPSVWQPCHVAEIVKYLVSRGYNYEVYKEFRSSKYILVYSNHVVHYNSCSAICNDLIGLYFEEKHEEENTFIKERNKRALKEKQFLYRGLK